MASFAFTQSIGNAREKLNYLAGTGVFYSIGRAVSLARQIGLQALRREAPKRTGRYAAGIIAKQRTSAATRSIRLEFYGPHPLSLWIIHGTRPHRIVPVRARALHFTVNGEEVFARWVSHPGTKPNPFHQRALRDLAGKLPPGFYGAVKETLDAL